MLGYDFDHHTIRNLTIAFGKLFSDINIIRKNGTEKQRIKVPLTYAPKQKFYVRNEQNPELNKKVAITVPLMSFALSTLAYDPTRKINKTQKYQIPSTDSTKKQLYTPVPYNLIWNLNVMVDQEEDILQIFEQIIPFFTPELTITVIGVPSIPVSNNIPITITSIAQDDTYQGSFEDDRRQDWTLAFLMKAYLYGPVSESNIIREVQIDLHDTPASFSIDNLNVPRNSRISIVPDPIDAAPGDDFEPDITVQNFDDSKKYNPETDQDEDI